jgi:hypothetical protein
MKNVFSAESQYHTGRNTTCSGKGKLMNILLLVAGFVIVRFILANWTQKRHY